MGVTPFPMIDPATSFKMMTTGAGPAPTLATGEMYDAHFATMMGAVTTSAGNAVVTFPGPGPGAGAADTNMLGFGPGQATLAPPGGPSFPAKPPFPIPTDNNPWEYDIDLTSPIFMDPIPTVDDVWNELRRCFNCNFPIAGAPDKLPVVGQHLPLHVNIGGVDLPFPVMVTQVEKTAGEINIEFVTLPGHIDGPGSTVHFRFHQEGAKMHLGIRGYITEGPVLGRVCRHPSDLC